MGTCEEPKAAELLFSATTIAGKIETNGNIHHLFEAQVERTPGAIALVFEDRPLTYLELNQRANQLASWLRKRGVGPETIVGIRVERSFEMMVAILGILKAGGAYLPIDPSYPSERQQFMLADGGVKLLLDQQYLPALEHQAEVFHLDTEFHKLAHESIANPVVRIPDDSLAYVIYTSGSTGKPKGVMLTHSNLVYSTGARFRYYPERVENYLLLSSFAFDSSVAGIFWTLCQGGTLTLPHDYSKQTGTELSGLILRHQVTHLLCLPSLYSVLLEQSASLRSLEVVIVAGESCPAALVRRHHELLPKTSLYNEYGPTEGTVWSTVFRCDRDEYPKGVPIGRAIPGAEVYILDDNFQKVRNGDAGELLVGGPGIARGYLNQPELTAARFVPDPFSSNPAARLYRTGDVARYFPDGNIEFLGRRDNQVKIRGYRIELEEVEAAIRQHAAVQEVAVVAHDVAGPALVNGQLVQWLQSRLSVLDPVEAGALLARIENLPAQPDEPESASDAAQPVDAQVRRLADFELSLSFKRKDFIRPPRDSQRRFLLNRALDEFVSDLFELDNVARRFVPGAEDADLRTVSADRATADLDDQEILEDWHIPLMESMARGVTESHGDILEIGFGRGIASDFIQNCGVRSHTIIECNDAVLDRNFEPWRARMGARDIRLVRGKWQDVIGGLGEFDGIFFQTYPLNQREFVEYLSRSATFAEHFFPVAAKHLRPGGAFTYLTHEIDSLSRRHQRLIFKFFKSLTTNVERLRVPADSRDLWWADSMVVVKAVK